MDNLTHSFVGLVAAKAGLERLSPGTTAVCVLAANAPDLDILALLFGKWFYVHHHRGITHSIIGTLTLAILIPSLFYGGDLLLARIRKREPRVRFRGLLIASLIVSATHPLMDWTNNYGVRPFLPWSGEWYYGDLVFIVDPWIWLVVGGAGFLLTSKRTWQIVCWTLLALVLTALVFSARVERTGLLYPNLLRTLWIVGILGLTVIRLTFVQAVKSKVAIVALAFVLFYWSGLGIAHRSAVGTAHAIAKRLSEERGETLGKVAAMPTLADPSRWLCVATTDRATYRFFLSLSVSPDEFSGEVARFVKPEGPAAKAFEKAAQDERAQIFLQFARFPAYSAVGDCFSEFLVQFADIRYTEPGASQRGTFSLEVVVACDSESEQKN